MQTFNHCSSKHHIPSIHSISAETILLLDIETTGLSPDTASIFMIGCGYYKDQCLHTIHWLADDYECSSEQDILQTFSDWFHEHFHSSKNVHMITYNGQNFDLPFLKSRYEQCQMMWPFSNENIENCIDYYRRLSTLKHLWPIKNLKLHTLSTWLGYTTSRAPSGRQLIKTFHSYIKTKDPALLNLLFLHNIDDLEALSKILNLETYFHLFNGNYAIHSVSYSENAMVIELKPGILEPFPSNLEYAMYGYELKIQNHSVTVHIPMFSNGLRYYYSDYKNYVYLPSEDQALPQSMAKYIDKSHWIKATAENCYTWFAPDQSFFNNEEKQRDYIQMIFKLFRFI